VRIICFLSDRQDYWLAHFRIRSVVWSARVIGLQDITRIEKVQRHFTQTFRGFGNLCCADRLTNDLPSFVDIRLFTRIKLFLNLSN